MRQLSRWILVCCLGCVLLLVTCYRVQWGNAAAAPYALIDLQNRLIVEDSNPNNARKEPIKPRVFQ